MGYQFQPIAMMGEQFNPMDSLAQSAQLQAAYQQNQMRAMQIAEMQRQQQEAQAQRTAGRNASVYAPQTTVQSPGMTLGSMGQGAWSENLPNGTPASQLGISLPNITPSVQVQGPAGADYRNQYIAELGKQGQGQMIPGARKDFAAEDAVALAQKNAQQKAVDEHNQSVSIAGKNDAEADKAKVETAQKHISAIGQVANSLLPLPDDQAAALYPAAMGILKSQGIDTSQLPQQWDRQLATRAAGAAVTVEKQLELDRQAKNDATTHALTKRGQDITIRGQNMTDARAKDANKMKAGGVSYAELPAPQQRLADEIGVGKMSMKDLARIATSNPGLLGAVSEKYPDFDQGKIASAVQAQRDFTGAGKYGIQLQSGSTAMRHFAQLREINDNNTTTVRIPGTAANKAYNNLLDTVAGEVATFYGMPKTNETLAGIKGTLGGLTNRDAAINEQAKAMGEKFDELENTWKESQPSASYHRPMPGYSAESKAARAKLDPEYAKRLQGAPAGSNPPAAGGDPFAQFGGVKH